MIFVLSCIQPFLYAPHFPGHVVVHMDNNMQPDNIIQIRTYINLSLMIPLFLLLTFLFINWMIKKLPDEAFVIPHTRYWLNNTNRETTILTVRNMIIQLGITFLIFFMVLNHFLYYFNSHPQLKSTPVLLSLFFMFTLILAFEIIGFFIKFKRMPR